MKFVFRFCGLLLLFACLPGAWAQPTSLRVSKIVLKHIGPPAAGDSLIRANIRVKVGDPCLPLALHDDVQNLYATGLFYSIQVADEVTSDGVVVTYILQAKPRLTSIKFQGNTEYKDSKLQKKITSKIGQPLDEQKLFTDCQEIQKHYAKGGYAGTEVKYVLSMDPEAGRGTATFVIKESLKVKILDVIFDGASAFSQKQLRKVAKTRRHWMFSWLTRKGFINPEVIDEDKDRLAEFYRQQGYIDFELKDVRTETPTDKTVIVHFVIYEGRQYKVGSVKLTGNKLFTTEQIIQGLRDLQPKGVLAKKIKLGPHGLKMDSGDVFTPEGYLQDMRQLENFYGARGYLDVSSGRTLNVTRVPNTETGNIDLEFKIDEGQQNRIEKIEIRGNVKTKDRVIRRELSVSPGDVFDTVRVDRSKQRLEGLQYFAKVDARPEATEPPIPGRKNLIIGVDEAETGRMTMGAGFSSIDSLVAFAEVSQGNFDLFHPPTFTGGGQKFRLRVQLGTERQDYLLSYIYPWFLGRHMTLDADLYFRDLNFESPNDLYDKRLAGTHVGISKALGSEFLIGSVGYSFEQVNIILNGSVTSSNGPTTTYIPPTIVAESGYSLVSKFDASLAIDTRNSTQLPDKGHRTELTMELAGPFGGEKEYYKVILKSHWFFKGLFPGNVLEVAGTAGIADSYGSTSMVPFYDRYYLGGLGTLRGFEYRNVSPRDPPDADGNQSKEPVGGDSYWFGSIEYSVPIIEHLRFAVFYDIGNVRVDPYSFGLDGVSDDWGFGIRLNIPRIGPLRLDYGIPLRHDKFNDGGGRIQFSAGFERPF